MQFNPLENEQTNTARESKTKTINVVPVPLSIRQLQRMVEKKQVLNSMGRIALLGRIVRLKEMVGRTIATISDQTGVINVIQVQNTDILQEDQYYHFIVNIRMDKDEAVFMSNHCQKITDFNRIQFHFANIMMSQCQNSIQA